MRCKWRTDGKLEKIDEMEACNIFEDQLTFDTSTYMFIETISDFTYSLYAGTSANKSWETNYGL